MAQKTSTWVSAALALLIAAGAFGVWRSKHAEQTLAIQRLAIAAEQRRGGYSDQIIWDYQERVRQNPDDVQGYAVLGSAYVQKVRETGDPSFYAKAQEAFQEALRRDPQNIDALVGQGTLANARHQFREALRFGEQAKALNSSVARVYGVIADAQIELGMYDQAIETLQTMVDLRPDLSSYSRVSYVRELHGDLEGAIEAMQLAVDASGPATENNAWTRVQLGTLLFSKGELAAAEREYERTLALLPDYPYAQAGLARVWAAQGRVDEAIQLYSNVVARMPIPEFVIGLGELQEANGQVEAAGEQYALVQAMQQLFNANGVDTDLDLALFAADHGNDPANAVAMARAAYAARPSVKAADSLGWALFKAGQFDEARPYAEEALRLGTQDALMLYHAGMIAQAQGDDSAARLFLEQALALNPHFSPLYAPMAKQALAGIAQAEG
jgi:tetratricopeptide (TPR) repeat protein